MRGGADGNARSLNVAGSKAGAVTAHRSGSDGGNRPGQRAGAAEALLAARTEGADLFDEVAAERGRVGDLAIGFRLGNIIGSAERKGSQAHLRIAPGERRGHDHDEIAALLEQKGQGRDPVDVGHVDIEDDHIGIGAFDLLDGLAPAAQRSHDLQSRLGLDPAHQQAAHDDGIVHDHHADGIMSRRDSRMQAGFDDTRRHTQYSC
jgi:hypothetical protein